MHVLQTDVDAGEKRSLHGVGVGVDGVEYLPRQRPELLAGMVEKFHLCIVMGVG